ncbi:MAG: phytoene desaturase family protein [Acidimicrobiales bacterium]
MAQGPVHRSDPKLRPEHLRAAQRSVAPQYPGSGVTKEADALVIGSGPNGLAAAVVLAAAGLQVRVYEAEAAPGGGCRTEDLTLPGFHHDVCSAAHPLAAASGFFQRFDLAARGVRLLQPEIPFAHPLGGTRAAAVSRSYEETADGLGADGPAYRRLMAPLVCNHGAIADAVLSSMRSLPARPWAAASFVLDGIRSAASLVRRFEGEEARALLGGVSAHAMLPLQQPPTGGLGLILTMLAHGVGWPVVEGGSVALVTAMTDAIASAGGEVVTDRRITSLRELPPAGAILLDVTPRALLELAGPELPAGYRRQLSRFRYGAGVCKVDWALSGPVPWTAEVCRSAGTLHLGGTFEEVARSEAEVANGRVPEKPYVLVVQPGVVDAERAPEGCQTLWSYCHVPSGSSVDMSEAVATTIERFAPGFRDLVLAKSTRTAPEVATHNANYIGGDISAGAVDLRQTIARPGLRWNPYRTPREGLYLCSSSTAPGPGVHGRCGELAARSALRDVFGIRRPPDIAPKTPVARSTTG